MTEEQADTKIKTLLDNPFAVAREYTDITKGSSLRYYVGYSAHFGCGATWEDAFDNLKPSTMHALSKPWRTPRFHHRCTKCRAKRSTLKARF